MKLKRSPLVNIGIALLIATFIVILSQRGLLQRLQLGGLDLLFRLKGPSPSLPNIIIIELDDECILKVGRWPWKRTWHAALTKAIKELGAKSLYFDILFSEPATDEEDDLFSQAMQDAGNVYLPFVFPERSTDISGTLFPIKKLSSQMSGMGSFNSYPDGDGVLRKMALVFIDEENVYYHISLKLAMDYEGLKFNNVEGGHLFLSGPKGRVKIPLIEDNKMLINWRGKWIETFKHYSYIDILNAYQDILEGKKPKIDVEHFKNSLCLVGATAIGLYDIASIPIEPEYPAIGSIATTINNILQRQFIKTLPLWMYSLLILLLSLISSLIITGEKVTREILLIIFIACFFITADFMLFKKNLWIDPSAPLISLFLTYLAINTYNFIIISTEKKTFFKLSVTDELTKLFNIRYFNIILTTECIMAKADVSKQFCIVMVDIDHFKHVNDTYGHRVGDLVLKEVATVLSTSVRSSDVVARYGGEEMIILLRGNALKSGLDVAEELRKKVETHKISDENNTYNVAISLGVSSFKSDDNENKIIQRADEGLYKAKNSGRNREATVEKSSLAE